MKKVLIADDDRATRQLVRITLDEGDLELLQASDGNEAVEIARAEHPDLVLLDIMMPGLSGIDACRRLKSDPETSESTVIMLTARAHKADRDDAEAAGADGFITKPFSPLELLRLVDEVLNPSDG